MNHAEFYAHLDRLDACYAAREWAKGKSLEEVWSTCDRGDWMYWLAYRAGIEKRLLVAVRAEHAALVLHLMKDERSRNAVEVSRAYGRNEATDQDLAAAAAAAAYADAAYAAAAAAAYDDDAAAAAAAYADAAAYAAYADAAYAAAAAAAYDDDAAAAAAAYADAAAYAASAAYADAAAYDDDAAAAAARQATLKRCADLMREYIPVELLKLNP